MKFSDKIKMQYEKKVISLINKTINETNGEGTTKE